MTTTAQTKALLKYDIQYDGLGYIISSKYAGTMNYNVYASEEEFENLIEVISNFDTERFKEFCNDHEFNSFVDYI